MSELNDVLQGIADDAWESTAGKQAELVNQDFMLLSATLVDYEFEGEKRTSWVGVVEVEGEEPTSYWLSGALVRPQMDYLMKNELLPVKARLVRDAERKGSPYVLQAFEERAQTLVEQANAALNPPDVITEARAAGALPKLRNRLAKIQTTVDLDTMLKAVSEADLNNAFQLDEEGLHIVLDSNIGVVEQAKVVKMLQALAA